MFAQVDPNAVIAIGTLAAGLVTVVGIFVKFIGGVLEKIRDSQHEQNLAYEKVTAALQRSAEILDEHTQVLARLVILLDDRERRSAPPRKRKPRALSPQD